MLLTGKKVSNWVKLGHALSDIYSNQEMARAGPDGARRTVRRKLINRWGIMLQVRLLLLRRRRRLQEISKVVWWVTAQLVSAWLESSRSMKKKQQVVVLYHIDPDDQDVTIYHLIRHYVTKDLTFQAFKSLACNRAIMQLSTQRLLNEE